MGTNGNQGAPPRKDEQSGEWLTFRRQAMLAAFPVSLNHALILAGKTGSPVDLDAMLAQMEVQVRSLLRHAREGDSAAAQTPVDEQAKNVNSTN